MQVDYLEYLPDDFKVSAIRLYFKALKEKLEPILGSDGRAQEALASNIATDQCIVAICSGKLVGIMGIQTNKRGLLNPSLKTMIRIYGNFGGILRMGGLAILQHTIGTDELYVDAKELSWILRDSAFVWL
jgi:hypothetical protein